MQTASPKELLKTLRSGARPCAPLELGRRTDPIGRLDCLLLPSDLSNRLTCDCAASTRTDRRWSDLKTDQLSGKETPRKVFENTVHPGWQSEQTKKHLKAQLSPANPGLPLYGSSRLYQGIARLRLRSTLTEPASAKNSAVKRVRLEVSAKEPYASLASPPSGLA